MGAEDKACGGYTGADLEGCVPMGRFAGPEGVARVGEERDDPEQSAFVNGHTLSVEGGWFGEGGWESVRRRKHAL